MRMPISPVDLTVLIPIYNDWDSLRVLLREFEHALAPDYRLNPVLVDESSTQPRPDGLVDYGLSVLASATCLQLK
jgi:hypothetical protein